MSNQLEEVYQNLYRIWKLEITSLEIKKIPNASCFLKDLQDIVTSMKNQLAQETNQIGKLILKKTLQNIMYMLNDLLEIRAEKMLNAAKKLKKIDETVLLDIEQEYYRQLFTAFKGYSKTKSILGSNEDSTIEPKMEDGKSETKESVNNLGNKPLQNNNSSEVPIESTPIIEIENPAFNQSSNITENQKNSSEIKKKIEPLIISPKNNTSSQDMTENTSTLPNKKILFAAVRFLQSLPALVGEDLGIYGPFHQEDIGYLPMKNAIILKEEKMAKILNESNH